MGQIQELGSTGSTDSTGNTSFFSSDDLQYEVKRLIEGSMSLNTMKTYDTGLAAFTKILQIQGINENWPPKLDTVVYF